MNETLETLIKRVGKQPNFITNDDLLELIQSGEIIAETQYLSKDGELVGTSYDREIDVVNSFYNNYN